jgi:Purple acid Phosphatase, N-terminal domain
MTTNCIRLFLIIIFLFGIFCIVPSAYAGETGILTLDVTPDATVMGPAPEFHPKHIKVVTIKDGIEVALFESDILKQEDIQVSVPVGTYKLYVQLQGHRTTWELDNEGSGYDVSSSSATVVPLWENTLLKDVFADAPWRTQTGSIPILIMVKDATGIAGDYDLGNIEIYLDEDCDKDDNEIDDILLGMETKWNGVTVDGSYYNLYYPGDWYGIIYLDPSEHEVSGEACFHVVIRDIGGWLDPDGDTHSHFNVTIASETLPTLPNWHAGDTHYHSSYTDNVVEFGFPVESTVEAGRAIGLDWNAITDHSFDIRDSKTANPNHKFNALKHDVGSYSTGSYRLILGEEVSCYGHESLPLVPRGVVHFLIFGMENFSNVGGTGLDFIPGSQDEKPEGGLTWNLEDVIDVVNSQGGVSYAAHPEGHRDASAAAFDRVPWITEDYDLVGYNGLQVWNMINNDNERDLGLEQWRRLLLNGRKDVFIAGGSDAHGDFSHATTVIGPIDNAFGKVRTYIYCKEFTDEGILNALKNGHSIMSDGPLVIFNITNERGETAIIGDEITGYDLTLNIQWESTLEFGNVCHIYFIRGVIGETEGEIDDYHISPDSLSNSKVYTDLASKIPLMKNGYVRIHATTDKGHSVYTNPIWISSSALIISNVSITGITADSAIITWDTNGLSSSLVKYGAESGNYTLQKYDLVNVTSHSIHLFGLLPDTTYYFVVNSTDQHGNSNQSNEYDLTTEILRIPLQAGWNLISLPLIPEDTSVDMVLSPIMGDYSIIWAYNASDTADHWKKYDPGAPFGNDLTTMEAGKGYWIMMISDDTLHISGTVPESTDINLKTGWNLIGYNSLDNQPIAEALSSISGNYTIVWAYDAGDTADHWKKYDPLAPFGNDLEIMEPGKGYWIMMSANDYLRYSFSQKYEVM